MPTVQKAHASSSVWPPWKFTGRFNLGLWDPAPGALAGSRGGGEAAVSDEQTQIQLVLAKTPSPAGSRS